MRSSGSMLITCLAVLILGPALALANGFYTPTVGPRAGAMGGAFIGLADDYSAVYWNPAGITQIKGMEVTATGHDVVSLASRDGYATYDGYGIAGDRFAMADIGATNQVANHIAPAVFFYSDAGPLRSVFDKVGIAAYTLTEYGTTWSGDDVLSNRDFIGHEHDFDIRGLLADMQDYESRIKTYVISPVVAKEIIPGLSVGATANIAYSHFKLSNVQQQQIVEFIDLPAPSPDVWGLYLVPVQFTDDATAWGFGATVGLLYRASSQVSVGLTVRSPMTMSYEGTYGAKYDSDWIGSVEEKYNEDFELRLPTWAGAGFAYRDFLFDGLTLTGDVQWTDWSTFDVISRTVVVRDSLGEEMSVSEVTRLDWEDTLEVAVGFDYRLGRSLALNMGYRNAPSPVADKDYDFVMPQATKNVIGMGVTYRQDFWRASFALEYHAGDERRIVGTDDMNGKHIEDLLIPSLSFTYAF